MVFEVGAVGLLFSLHPCLPLGQTRHGCALVVHHRHVHRGLYNNSRRMSPSITVSSIYEPSPAIANEVIECGRLITMIRVSSDEKFSPPQSANITTEVACNRAVGNLILMAVCNIIINIALIILPFPMLRHLRLDIKEKLQLGFLFSVGAVLVAITILRLPLILNESVSQRSRSMVFSRLIPDVFLFINVCSGLQLRFSVHASSPTPLSSTLWSRT